MRIWKLVVLFCFAISAMAEEGAEWKAAFARVDLTPEKPVFMAGYASRNKPFDSVEAKLFAKAMALTDSKGSSAVLITTDLIGFSAAVSDPIFDRIAAETGLQRADILLNSSHTHTGPSLTLDATKKGGEAQVEYTRLVQDRIVQLAVDVLKEEAQPAVLSRGLGIVNFVMNRREWTRERGVILGVNPRGPADRSVPVLRIATPGEDGKLLGVVFQAACHNTTLGGSFYGITGDYAGYSQETIEKEFPGVQAMFMIGCGGDANPYPRDNSIETSRKHGNELGTEVIRVLRETKKLKRVSGPLVTAFSEAKLPLEPLPSKEELSRLKLKPGGWRGFVAEEMSRFHEPEAEKFPEFYEAPMAVWQFGNDLTLVGLSGEVVVDYVRILERELGAVNLWISAYCNDVYGYLPSARVLGEGGYETRGLYYGVGFFRPEVEDVVADELRSLAIEAGRKNLPTKP